uniref:REJ domain-containing protein n=1 Tax=Tetradesmus obliquus TaxID=3088 RepID=A0A383WEY7_TETOB|eukprot:jgi/Sobl393_1/5340/SZX75649.1
MTSWAVTLESGQNVQCGTEVYLGDLAAAEGPLELTVNTSSSEFFINSSKRLQRFEGILRRSGTYHVQMTTHYATCEPQQAETRFTVSPCPAQAQASYQLQDCDSVTEPGKRKLSLLLDAFAPDSSGPLSWQWQVLPAASSSAIGSSVRGSFALLPAISFGSALEFGVGAGVSQAAAGAAPVATCQVETSSAQQSDGPSRCTLAIGSGAGKLRSGRSYIPMFAQQQQQQQQQRQQRQGDGLLWQELPAVQVPQCPPRITKANATLKGSCNQGSAGRWLQLTADAIDLEEGRNTQLQYYWYLLLARNRNVVLSDGTSGRKLSLRVGDGPRQVQPGRSYIIKVAVVAKDGKQAISTKQQVGRVLEVPLCS